MKNINLLVETIAFTLAETLVVMGIIGVVAALTIPNLNQSTGDREKVARLKKKVYFCTCEKVTNTSLWTLAKILNQR